MAGRQDRVRHGFAKHKWLKSIDSKLKFPTVPQSTHTEGRHVNVHKLSKCVCRQWLWLIPVHCRRRRPRRRQQNFWFTFTTSSLWTLPFMLELAQVLQQQQQQQPRQQNSANHQIIIIIIWIALLHWLLLLLVKLLLLQWTCQHWIEHITDWLPFSLFAFFRQCKTRSPSVWISVRVGTLNRTLRDLCSSIWTLWAAAAAAFLSPSLTTLSCYWAIIQILVTFIIYFCTLPLSFSLCPSLHPWLPFISLRQQQQQ